MTLTAATDTHAAHLLSTLPPHLADALELIVKAACGQLPADLAEAVVADQVNRLTWLLDRTKHNRRGFVRRDRSREFDAITAPALELAASYQPDHRLPRCRWLARVVAVAALRSSLLEDAHVHNTQEGMRSFGQLAAMAVEQLLASGRPVTPIGDDPYAAALNDFPAATEALAQVAEAFRNGQPSYVRWAPVQPRPASMPPAHPLSTGHFARGSLQTELDEFLTGSLNVEDPHWVVPGFRSLSRNPYTLGSLLESLFAAGGTLLSGNYVLSNGELSSRFPLLGPHADLSVDLLLIDPSGLTEQHQQKYAQVVGSWPDLTVDDLQPVPERLA